MTTHLLVAPTHTAFGEVVLGLRIARELHARGDRVVFLAPSAHAVLLRGTPFTHEPIDRFVSTLDRQLGRVARGLRADDVILLDLMVTLTLVGNLGLDVGFLDALPVPVAALDIWDLRHSPLRLDLLGIDLTFPELARTVVPRRLVPVPFVRPSTAGAYCALPSSALTSEDRVRTRAQLGLADREPLVLLTSSSYQARSLTPGQLAVVGPVLERLAGRCQAAGDRVRVLHVGPEPLVGVGPRYQHHLSVPASEFERLVQAADLLVTANQSATGLSTAIALGVPALVAVNTAPTDLDAPAFRFRVFPYGFFGFLGQQLEQNPYVAAVPTVEIYAGDAIAERVHDLLFDEAARAAAQGAMAAYAAEIRRLPTAADRVRELFSA